MKIRAIFKIIKDTGEVYRVDREGTVEEEAGTLTVNLAGHTGLSITRSLPNAVLHALENGPVGYWTNRTAEEKPAVENNQAAYELEARKLGRTEAFKRAVLRVVEKEPVGPPFAGENVSERSTGKPVITIKPLSDAHTDNYLAEIIFGFEKLQACGLTRDQAVQNLIHSLGLDHRLETVLGLEIRDESA